MYSASDKKVSLAVLMVFSAISNPGFATDVNDFTTLDSAISAGNAGEINITENIMFDDNISSQEIDELVINGTGHTIDGNTKKGFSISSGQTVILKNIGDVTNEDTDNGLINFNNSVVGGAWGGNTTIENVKFANNDINVRGGTVYVVSGSVNINNSLFIGNKNANNDGGAINVAGELTINNSKFKNNETTGVDAGGAISASGGANIYINNTEFDSNQTKVDGGAINASYPKNFFIENSSFTNNIVSKNYSDGGGAIWLAYKNQDKPAIIYNTDFNNNSSANWGGAIAAKIQNTNWMVIDSSFTNNTATGAGGAILNLCSDCDLNIIADQKDVLFSNNISMEQPNDIYNAGGNINLYAANGRTIKFNSGIYSEENEEDGSFKDLNINNGSVSYTLSDDSVHNVSGAGEVQLNSDIQNLNINLYAGKLSLGQNPDVELESFDNVLQDSNFTVKGDSILNTANNYIGTFAPKSFVIDEGVNWEYQFDVDLANNASDKLVGADNKGNLKLSLLNLISDTTEQESRIAYSDTNINGQLTDDYKITTSTATYDVTTENDDTGSYLVFKSGGADNPIAGLPAAVQNASDVYSNTSNTDEVVNAWMDDNKLKADLVINANNKAIIAGQDGLSGIALDNNNTLTVNDATNVSGFDVALDNTTGTVNINNSNFSGNKGVAAVKNKDGIVNITASKQDVYFNNPVAEYEIQSDGGVINVSGGNKVAFAGKLQGANNAELNLDAGHVMFDGDVSGFNVSQKSGTVDIKKLSDSDYAVNNGILNIKNENDFKVTNFAFGGGNINLANGKTGDIVADRITLNGDVNMMVDVDLANEAMDRLLPNSADYNSGSININKFNLLSDATKSDLKINFTSDDTLKDHITTDVKNVYGPIFNYAVNYDSESGDFAFTADGDTAGGYNPSIFVAPVAAQLGGYLTQLNSYDQAFHNMDTYMLLTKAQRQIMKSRNKKASAHAKSEQAKVADNHVWVRPYAAFEKVNLKSGPRVSHTAYGSFFGAESGVYDIGNGWDSMWGAYVGYNGSHQKFKSISMNQNGATLGAVGMLYKDNFFTGLTINAGANAANANTMYGTDNLSMFMLGIASKTGYNIELGNGTFIVQPNYLMSYSFVNTFDYINAAAINVHSSPLNAIQIEPGLRFNGILKNAWQPYMDVSMVWNVLDKTRFSANDLSLPDFSVKPFAKYGLGISKTWNQKHTGYLQTYFTSGGRNGVGIQAGFKISLGKGN